MSKVRLWVFAGVVVATVGLAACGLTGQNPAASSLAQVRVDRCQIIPPGSPLRRAGALYGIIWVGKGRAPQGCGLQVDQFVPTRRPYPWWNITASQLRQVRAGQLSVLVITTVCGNG